MKVNNVSFTSGILIRGTQRQHDEIAKVIEKALGASSLLKVTQNTGDKPVILYATGDTIRKLKIYLPQNHTKYDAVMINPKNFGVKKLVRSAQAVLEAVKNHTFDFSNLAIYK